MKRKHVCCKIIYYSSADHNQWSHTQNAGTTIHNNWLILLYRTSDWPICVSGFHLLFSIRFSSSGLKLDLLRKPVSRIWHIIPDFLISRIFPWYPEYSRILDISFASSSQYSWVWNVVPSIFSDNHRQIGPPWWNRLGVGYVAIEDCDIPFIQKVQTLYFLHLATTG